MARPACMAASLFLFFFKREPKIEVVEVVRAFRYTFQVRGAFCASGYAPRVDWGALHQDSSRVWLFAPRQSQRQYRSSQPPRSLPRSYQISSRLVPELGLRFDEG
jgi:hypothetical protein